MEIADVEKLKSALQSLIESSASCDVPVGGLPACSAALINVIETVPEFHKLSETLQFVGSSGTAFDTTDLATWTFARAKVVGAEQAIDEVRLYFETAEFPVYKVMLLVDLVAHQEFDLGDGIKLGRPGAVPIQSLKAILIGRPYAPLMTATAVIFREVRLPRFHGKSDDPHPDDPDLLRSNELDEIRLCLSLGGGKRGPQAIATTVVPADSVPHSAAFLWTLHSFRASQGVRSPVTADEIIQAKVAYAKFRGLPDGKKARLLIPMERLNEFWAERSIVQQAIDLRVALESLFLDKGNKAELSYRLAMRAAYFSGATADERKRIFQTVRDAYEFGSIAVHTGHIKPSKLAAADKANADTAEIVRASILKFMETPNVDFEDLILNG